MKLNEKVIYLGKTSRYLTKDKKYRIRDILNKEYLKYPYFSIKNDIGDYVWFKLNDPDFNIKEHRKLKIEKLNGK